MKRHGRWVALVALAALAGCAYFNTLYNAKQRFKEAEKIQRGRDGQVTRQQKDAYDEVIAKCQTMIGTYPKSRHVDDAMFLIARSLHAQERFGEAAAECDSLAAKFPESNLLPAAHFLKGRSLAEWGEYEAAIEVLDAFVQRYPKHKRRPYALYFLATSAMSLDREEDALAYVQEMEKRYPKDRNTFEAQIEAARILSEKGMHDRAIGVYEALNSRRLPESSRYQVWMGMGQAYVETGAYAQALELVSQLETLVLKPTEKPPVMLLKARAQMGAGDRDVAIKTYARLIKQYTRGQYVSEAGFRLGEIYEEMDSLAVAKTYFEGVPAAFANSPFATEAIKRTGSIDKLLKLQEAEAADSPEAQALRLFSMAELQMFQFVQPEKALQAYQELLDTYPESEYAPRAAYAVGYIQAVVLGDTLAARATCDLLKSRYPESQQAAYTYLLLGGQPTRDYVPVPAPAIEGGQPPPAPATEGAAAAPDTARTKRETPPQEREE